MPLGHSTQHTHVHMFVRVHVFKAVTALRNAVSLVR